MSYRSRRAKGMPTKRKNLVHDLVVWAPHKTRIWPARILSTPSRDQRTIALFNISDTPITVHITKLDEYTGTPSNATPSLRIACEQADTFIRQSGRPEQKTVLDTSRATPLMLPLRESALRAQSAAKHAAALVSDDDSGDQVFIPRSPHVIRLPWCARSPSTGNDGTPVTDTRSPIRSSPVPIVTSPPSPPYDSPSETGLWPRAAHGERVPVRRRRGRPVSTASAPTVKPPVTRSQRRRLRPDTVPSVKRRRVHDSKSEIKPVVACAASPEDALEIAPETQEVAPETAPESAEGAVVLAASPQSTAAVSRVTQPTGAIATPKDAPSAHSERADPSSPHRLTLVRGIPGSLAAALSAHAADMKKLSDQLEVAAKLNVAEYELRTVLAERERVSKIVNEIEAVVNVNRSILDEQIKSMAENETALERQRKMLAENTGRIVKGETTIEEQMATKLKLARDVADLVHRRERCNCGVDENSR